MSKSFKPLSQFDVSEEELRVEIGHKIRKVRMEAGYSIKDLAECLGVTRGFISNVEHGTTGCSLANLIKISKAFDIDPAWLAGFRPGEKDPFSPAPSNFDDDNITLKELYLQKSSLKSDHLSSVVIETADMSPIIKPGSVVIANVEQQGIFNRELYLLKVPGNYGVRWVEATEDGGYKIEGEKNNRLFLPNCVLTREEFIADIEVVGKVELVLGPPNS